VAHLSVITLRVPSLRDYAEDVPIYCATTSIALVDDQQPAAAPLQRRRAESPSKLSLAGNIGELKILVQRVLILGVGEEISLEEIEPRTGGENWRWTSRW